MEKNTIINALVDLTGALMDSVKTENVVDDINVLSNLRKIIIKNANSDKYYTLSDVFTCDGCNCLTLEIEETKETEEEIKN